MTLKMTTKQYRKFEPLELPVRSDTGNTFGVFGASKQGKTNAVIWLWQKYFKSQGYITVLCTPSEKSTIYDIFKDYAIITPFYSTFTELVKAAWTIQNATSNKYKFLFILDDVVTHKSNKVLRELIMTMRNSNISTILSIQGQTLVDKNNRHNLNFCLFFRYNGLEGARDVVQRFLGDIIEGKSIDEKARVYQAALEGHRFLLLNALGNDYTVAKLPPKLVV